MGFYLFRQSGMFHFLSSFFDYWSLSQMDSFANSSKSWSLLRNFSPYVLLICLSNRYFGKSLFAVCNSIFCSGDLTHFDCVGSKASAAPGKGIFVSPIAAWPLTITPLVLASPLASEAILAKYHTLTTPMDIMYRCWCQMFEGLFFPPGINADKCYVIDGNTKHKEWCNSTSTFK